MTIKNIRRKHKVPKAGSIRLGSPKTEKQPGRNQPYFRLDTPHFTDEELKEKLGENPEQLSIYFPKTSQDEQKALEFIFEDAYKAFKGQHLFCQGDGETAWRSESKGQLVEVQCPCPFLTGDKPICKQQAELRVGISDLAFMGFFHVRTTSWESLISIRETINQMHNILGERFWTTKFILFKETKRGERGTQYITKLSIHPDHRKDLPTLSELGGVMIMDTEEVEVDSGVPAAVAAAPPELTSPEPQQPEAGETPREGAHPQPAESSDTLQQEMDGELDLFEEINNMKGLPAAKAIQEMNDIDVLNRLQKEGRTQKHRSEAEKRLQMKLPLEEKTPEPEAKTFEPQEQEEAPSFDPKKPWDIYNYLPLDVAGMKISEMEDIDLLAHIADPDTIKNEILNGVAKARMDFLLGDMKDAADGAPWNGEPTIEHPDDAPPAEEVPEPVKAEIKKSPKRHMAERRLLSKLSTVGEKLKKDPKMLLADRTGMLVDELTDEQLSTELAYFIAKAKELGV